MKTLLLFLLTLPLLADFQGACGDAGSGCTVTGAFPWTMPAGVPAGYETLSYGQAMTYALDVPDGIYILTLSFLEPNLTGTAQRVFSVTANDAPFLPSLAIGAANTATPLVRSGIVVVAGGKLVVRLTSLNGRNAILSRMALQLSIL